MSQNTLTFALTPAEFTARKVALIDNGIIISSNAGEVSHSGVTVSYNYNGTDTLTIVVLHKPFIVAEGKVEGYIKEWFSTELPPSAK